MTTLSETRPIDPNIAAAHADDPSFHQFAGQPLPEVVQARGIMSAGEWSEPRVVAADPEDGFPRTQNFRTCGFCGSIHPEDLRGFIDRGEAGPPQMADWKYGYPHKVYVDVPNPLAGQQVQVSYTSAPDGHGGRTHTPHMGAASPFTHGKFYTRHLAELPDETFGALVQWLRQTGVVFSKDAEGKLMWAGRPAPGVRW